MLRKRLRTIVQVLFFLALGIALVWWMGKNISPEGWRQIRESLAKARYWVIIPVFFTILLSHYLRAVRWQLLIDSLGYKTRMFNLFSMVMIGYMSNLAIPRFGEILKCTLLSKYEKIPPEKLVGTIVAERAVDLICLIFITILTVMLQADLVGNFAIHLFKQIAGSKTEGILTIRFLIFLIGCFLLLYLFFKLLKRFQHVEWLQKVKQVLKGVYIGLMSIRKVKHKKMFLLHSVLIWTLYMLGIQIGFWALQETDGLSITVALSILSFGSLGMLVPTQGGLGSYQFAVQKTMLLYGIGEALGYAFGWILWIAQMGIVVVVGLLCFLLLPIYNRNRLKPV